MLKKLQMTPDDPQALATLPTLDLSDIRPRAEKFPLEVKSESSPTILFHDIFTSDIAYMQIGFNTETVPQDKIQYLPLLSKLVHGMGTKKRDYVEMSKLIGIHTGGIRHSHFSSSLVEDRHAIISYLFFSGKALMEKLDNLFDIYTELFTERSFDNHKRLVDIIRSAKADMEESIVPGGNQYVLSRLQSHQSNLGAYDEATDGIIYFRFLEELLKRAEKNPGEVAEEFRLVADLVLTRQNVLFNVTSDAKDYTKFQKRIDSLVRVLPDVQQEPASLEFHLTPVSEGFLTASAVQYVGKGANLYEMGYKYSGHFNVLKSLLSTGYLWERVRMQGGAYGCSNSFDFLTGDFGLVSYRDPNLTETLQIYDEVVEFLTELNLSKEELKKIIIGCVGHLDPPLTPDRKGSVSMVEYLTGNSWELRQKRREELLSTQMSDLKELIPLFEALKKNGTVCVLGNEEKVQKAKAKFDQLLRVFN